MKTISSFNLNTLNIQGIYDSLSHIVDTIGPSGHEDS